MTSFLAALARGRKALVAVAGGIAAVVALGVLHGDAQTWASAVLAFLTAIGVYAAPNAPAAPVVEAHVPDHAA